MMNSLVGRIVDLADDPDGELVKQAAAEGVLPDWVIDATVPDESVSYGYVDSGIEGRPLRKYALDTKAQVFLSTLYFLKYGHVFDKNLQRKVASNIRAANHFFGMLPPVLLEKVAAGTVALEPDYVPKWPLTPECFGYYRTKEDGAPDARWPLFTENHVKLACAYFQENYRFMEPELRREFAQKIVSRAEALEKEAAVRGPSGAPPQAEKAGPQDKATKIMKVPAVKLPKTPKPAAPAGQRPAAQPKVKTAFELPDLVLRYGGEAVSEVMPFAFKDRFERLEQGTQKWAALETLWENRGSFTLEKMAQAIEAFDREAGLDRLWDSKIPDPYLSVFTFEKEADGDQVIYDGNGLLVTSTMIKALAEKNGEKLAGLYDKSFADQFQKDPVTIFQSLPDPDKQAIAELATRGSQDAEAHTYPGSMSPGAAL